MWLQSGVSTGYAIDYPSIGMHAVARNAESFDRPCLLIHVSLSTVYAHLCGKMVVAHSFASFSTLLKMQSCCCAPSLTPTVSFILSTQLSSTCPSLSLPAGQVMAVSSLQTMGGDDDGGDDDDDEDAIEAAAADPMLSTQVRYIPEDPSIRTCLSPTNIIPLFHRLVD